MKRTFLLIDDDRDDIDLFLDALNIADPAIHCRVATSGPAAMAALDEAPDELPDLIFLDISMPRVDGWQCLAELKKHAAYSQVPVLMYSTSSLYHDANRALDTGALGFFTKPSSFQDLTEILVLISANLDKNLPASFVAFNERKSKKIFEY